MLAIPLCPEHAPCVVLRISVAPSLQRIVIVPEVFGAAATEALFGADDAALGVACGVGDAEAETGLALG